MGKLNRGNLLATLKKLKKTPRPKVTVANPAVQAICGVNDAPKPNKTNDLKATVERRRLLLKDGHSGSVPFEETEYFKKYEAEFKVFMEENYKKRELRRKQAAEKKQAG